jgi:N-acetylated-alpha-linked acidic dipeptidase
LRKTTLLLLGVSLTLTTTGQQTPLSFEPLGFSHASSSVEEGWETRFRAIPDAKRVHSNMERLAAHPHNVGSEYQRQNAEWLVAHYKEWGWDAHIERFDVLYPTPKERVLELVAPTKFVAKMDEPPLPEDPYTKEKSTQLPGYNVYSADGDVTAPLVYVNNGMPADYEVLERNGISVSGAIVISRYGGGWRGLKPKLAAEHGAVGCIIYSDPADDGYGQGEVLPKGPMRPPEGIQRGSVADTTLYPGDPLTPGIGSVPGAKRLKISEAQTIMKIPVLPIGYGDAKPLLAALEGAVVPAEWRGGLPLTYHFGPGPAKVHLKLVSDWSQKPVLDVIATMTGAEEPDVWIVRGNHYDGWVNGADDPISGQSALLEEARALGELAKQGWRPKRTLIYAAWDGEEPGLIGSTEWAETHADELLQHAALYINSDENGRGSFGAGGSHELEQVVNDVAKEVIDPETKVSAWKRQQAVMLVRGGRHSGGTPNGDVVTMTNLPLEAIGSGSDFAAFLDHFGIASLNVGYGGEDRGGTYHSAYDTPWFTDHFGDKEEVYGPVLAQTAGILVMRFASADVLPYDFTSMAQTLTQYDRELKELVKSLQDAVEMRARNLELGVYTLTDDPQKRLQPPPSLVPPPNMDFSSLDQAISALEKSATAFSQARPGMEMLSPEKRKALNADLTTVDRKLLGEGLPRRPWVKNLIYAPGVYAGYGVKTLPGVREALEQGRFAEGQEQLTIVSKAINNEASYIQQIADQFGVSGK